MTEPRLVYTVNYSEITFASGYRYCPAALSLQVMERNGD